MNYNKNMGFLDGKDARPPETPLLARQSSVYSLTFDEFQNTMGGMGLGKDFGSMNMDEFLKNIWTAEESQAMATTSVADAMGPSGGLQRQGSLTLPRTLSQKTVDEVWRGLAGGQHGFQEQRQPTLGEITLEEFLVRAGVVREDIDPPGPQPILNNGNTATTFGNSGLALGFSNPGMANSLTSNAPASLGMVASSARPYSSPFPLGNVADLANTPGMRGGGLVGIGDQSMNNGLMTGMLGQGGGGITVASLGSPANQTSSDGLPRGNGDLSSLSPVPYMFNGGLRGRKCGGAVEKVVERRQRRMIKNRESAARSRARKQAYTMELEAEIAKLKEQNEELQKKQAEAIEMQKNQVLEMINKPHEAKKRCLRRTQTGPW